VSDVFVAPVRIVNKWQGDGLREMTGSTLKAVSQLDGLELCFNVSNTKHEQVQRVIIGNAHRMCDHRIKTESLRKVFQFLQMAVLEDKSLVSILPWRYCLVLTEYSHPVSLSFSDQVSSHMVDAGDFKAFSNQRVGAPSLAKVAKLIGRTTELVFYLGFFIHWS